MEFKLDQEDIANTTAANLNNLYLADDSSAQEKRKKWLQDLEEWTKEMFDGSPHLVVLTEFLTRIT